MCCDLVYSRKASRSIACHYCYHLESILCASTPLRRVATPHHSVSPRSETRRQRCFQYARCLSAMLLTLRVLCLLLNKHTKLQHALCAARALCLFAVAICSNLQLQQFKNIWVALVCPWCHVWHATLVGDNKSTRTLRVKIHENSRILIYWCM